MRHIFSIAFVAATALAGCSESGFNSIYRTVTLDSGDFDGDAVQTEAAPSVVLDAKQRLVTNTRSSDGKRIICAEPSPDVAQGISRALTAALNVSNPDGTSASGSVSSSSAAAVAQLGERLATIQLLRDELADLCRAYSNGAVTQTHYTLRLSKLDDKMVTLLMGEMAAGAFGRPLAAIDGTAGGGFDRAAGEQEIKEAKTKVDAEKVKADEAAVALEEQRVREQSARDAATADNPNRENIDREAASTAAAEEKDRRAQENLRAAREELRSAETRFANSFAATTANFGAGDLGRRRGPDAEVASEIGDLQQAYLDSDDLTTLLNACIAALDVKSGDVESERLKLQTSIDDLSVSAYELEAEVKKLELEWASELDRASETEDDKEKRFILAKADQVAQRYHAKKTDVSAVNQQLTQLVQAQRQLIEDALPTLTPLGDICKSRILDIQNAMIAQQVRQTQLRALMAEQDSKLAAAQVNKDAAQLSACSAVLASSVALPLDGLPQGERAQIEAEHAAREREARTRCLNILGSQ